MPILIYSLIISKNNTADVEAESELEHKSKYNKQQFLIFIPLFVFFAAVTQEIQGKYRSRARAPECVED